MKTYFCTKTVDAKKMLRSEAQKLGLIRDVSQNEEEGYFVRYVDGYESWSPKQAFEDGYSDTAENNEG